MSSQDDDARRLPSEVPTLTEVVRPVRPAIEVTPPADLPLPAARVADPLPAEGEPSASVRQAWQAETEERIATDVLHDVQRQVDRMLEFRLRESLAPVLGRLADQLVHEVREEVLSTLRDVIRRAVAQELSRRRSR